MSIVQNQTPNKVSRAGDCRCFRGDYDRSVRGCRNGRFRWYTRRGFRGSIGGQADLRRNGRRNRRPGRDVECLPNMQERGATHAIGLLELGNADPVSLAQTVKRIAGLNDIDDPTGRPATRYRSLGGYRRNVEDHSGKQPCRQQAVGLLQPGHANMVPCCNFIKCIARLNNVGQPTRRRWTIGR
jgi:hypothetical protein